jgi:hypothetical protein
MASVLTLGGIVFDDFSTPSAMGAGGKQAMVIHKLPGGSRVIDTLGLDAIYRYETYAPAFNRTGRFI